eukprot:COSAG06_NODE_3844_length_4842_cov_139.818258_3_plen_75_part_00
MTAGFCLCTAEVYLVLEVLQIEDYRTGRNRCALYVLSQRHARQQDSSQSVLKKHNQYQDAEICCYPTLQSSVAG